MLTFRSLAVVPSVCLLTLGASAGGKVHVVDDTPGPGVDFTSLAAALAATADGDIVLVRDGTYAMPATNLAFEAGRSIALVADAGHAPRLASPLFVGGGSGQQLVLRGIDFDVMDRGTAIQLPYGGSLFVEDAVVTASTALLGFGAPTGSAIDAGLTGRIVVTRSLLQGSTGVPYFSNGGSGLRSMGAACALYLSELRGGDGRPNTGAAGGAGIDHLSFSGGAFVYALGTAIRGGNGAAGPAPLGVGGCNGGPGGGGISIHGNSGTPVVPASSNELGCTLAGGVGGSAYVGASGCVDGPAGVAVDVAVTGAHTALVGSVHAFEATSPVREGQTLELRYSGAPGELVFVDVSAALGFTYVPEFKAVRAVSAPIVLFQGVIPPSGLLQKSVVIQELGAGIEGTAVHLQAAYFSANDGIYLGAPSSVVLLDAAQ